MGAFQPLALADHGGDETPQEEVCSWHVCCVCSLGCECRLLGASAAIMTAAHPSMSSCMAPTGACNRERRHSIGRILMHGPDVARDIWGTTPGLDSLSGVTAGSRGPASIACPPPGSCSLHQSCCCLAAQPQGALACPPACLGSAGTLQLHSAARPHCTCVQWQSSNPHAITGTTCSCQAQDTQPPFPQIVHRQRLILPAAAGPTA